MGSHFGVGEFTTHFRTYFRGDWDVLWGYGFLNQGHISVQFLPFARIRFVFPPICLKGHLSSYWI